VIYKPEQMLKFRKNIKEFVYVDSIYPAGMCSLLETEIRIRVGELIIQIPEKKVPLLFLDILDDDPEDIQKDQEKENLKKLELEKEASKKFLAKVKQKKTTKNKLKGKKIG
tara:strand:- start:2762 stop:3094 length:333 start_codon:yes stop_codon:yes gene_type:complete